jgi:hypothetical protein
MRVFIGYGYNERDRWIETYIIPLLEAFGCRVAHGKVAYGGALPPEVVDLIRSSDAMIGFTTRRDAAGPGQFTTHPWVVQELVTAYAQVPAIPFVEVREEGVVSPGGMLEAVNAQRIDYREADRAACLLHIAQALRRLLDQLNVTTLRLGPPTVIDQIRVLLDDPTFTATSQVLRGDAQLTSQPVAVFPIKGGLFVKLRGILEGDLIRVTVAARGQTWHSSFESIDAYNVDLVLK